MKAISSPSLKTKKKQKQSTSSPARAENYPPSLMRFLSSSRKNSNGGNSSCRSRRRRSRSSPMFIIRKINNILSSVDTQEPSSPKVTCMGQVRVTRSRAGRSNSRKPVHHHHPCRWLHNALLCTSSSFINTKLKYCALFRMQLRKWIVFLRLGFRRKVESSSKKGFFCKESKSFTAAEPQQSQGGEEREEAEDLVNCSSSTPPRNAFLLTRRRSTPYRSSLAIRFRGSPKQTAREKEENRNDNDPIPTTPETECDHKDLREEELITNPEDAPKLCLANETDAKSSCTNITGVLNPGDMTYFVRPPLLTRCKSEPARKEGILKLDFIGRRSNPQVCD